MRGEIVLHLNYGFGFREMHVAQVFEHSCVVHAGFALCDFHLPPSQKRRHHHEDPRVPGSPDLLSIIYLTGGGDAPDVQLVTFPVNPRAGDVISQRRYAADQAHSREKMARMVWLGCLSRTGSPRNSAPGR